MQIIDIHTHLYDKPDLDVQFNLGSYDIRPIAEEYVDRLGRLGVDYALAIVNDDDFLKMPGRIEVLNEIRDSSERFSTAFLIDPTREDAIDLVEIAADSGGAAIKFHPYLNDLTRGTYARAIEVVTAAEKQGLFIIVDCSYGGKKFYDVNGVELSHTIAGKVNSPVLLAHGGGARVLEAFAAAESYDNVYLDTSFSIPYWSGSSVPDDFVFAMERMEMERWLWGSDMPMMGVEQSRDAVESLLRDRNLVKYQKKLFFENAKNLMDI